MTFHSFKLSVESSINALKSRIILIRVQVGIGYELKKESSFFLNVLWLGGKHMNAS